MKNTQTNSATDPSLIAAVHAVGQGWRVVVARKSGLRPALVEAREFPSDQSSRVSGYLAEKLVGRTILVLPSSSAICRTCPLPNVGPEQMDAALRLQAEAHLLGGTPTHRVGLAVLPLAAGESSRCGLILAWPESAPASIPPGMDAAASTFVPDVACLAALLNGLRPAEPLIWLNREDGSLAIGLCHAQGAVFRATRESAEDGDWAARVNRVLAETAFSVGHTPEFVEQIQAGASQLFGQTDPGQLVLPAAVLNLLPSRLDGSPRDTAWCTKFGIAAGAIIAAMSELAPLTALTANAPKEAPSILGSLVSTLSRPRVAATLAAAAIAIVAFGPLVLSFARLQVLRWKVGDEGSVIKANDQGKKTVAMYQELQKRSWPMLKVFSDVCNATPLGVDLDSINIIHGEPVLLVGVAKPDSGRSAEEVVADFEKNLTRFGLFGGVAKKLEKADAKGAVAFRMNAQVNNPFKNINYDQKVDFAMVPLQVQKFGPPPEWVTDREGFIKRRDAKQREDWIRQGLINEDGTPKTASNDHGDVIAVDPATEDSTTSGRIIPTPPPDDVAIADGEGVVGSGEPSTTAPSDAEAKLVGVDSRGGALPREGAPGMASHSSDRPANAGPREQIPPPLTKEQINAMKKAEAQEALSKVSAAMKYAPDDAVKSRLKSEFQMLLQRTKEATE